MSRPTKTPRVTTAAITRAVKYYRIIQSQLRSDPQNEQLIQQSNRAAHNLAKLTSDLVEQDMDVPLMLTPQGEAVLAQQS